MIADEEVRLTQMSKTAGCAAKIGPGTLAGILESLPKFQDENLLVESRHRMTGPSIRCRMRWR